MNDFYHNRVFNIQWMSTTMIDFYYKSDSIFNECLLKWSIFTTKVINIQWMSSKMKDF